MHFENMSELYTTFEFESESGMWLQMKCVQEKKLGGSVNEKDVLPHKCNI
jgi:hypothetical protein